MLENPPSQRMWSVIGSARIRSIKNLLPRVEGVKKAVFLYCGFSSFMVVKIYRDEFKNCRIVEYFNVFSLLHTYRLRNTKRVIGKFKTADERKPM